MLTPSIPHNAHGTLPDEAVEQAVCNAARMAQRRWELRPVRERVQTVRRLRFLLARDAELLANAVPVEVAGKLQRSLADTLAAEVLPLAEACTFLEREAVAILAGQRLSNRSRPFWLRRVTAEVSREALGVVLVIGPANYPLFLPGVQVLQALVAGNAVLWKPAATGVAAAHALQQLLTEAGLPAELLAILDAAPAAAERAIAMGVDKVILTGHVDTGRAVLRQLAETVTPSVMELSGCDAVFVLDGADCERAARAIAFGVRLNGSATCMAPRRLFVAATVADALLPLLHRKFAELPLVSVSEPIRKQLERLMEDACNRGARVTLDDGGPYTLRSVLIEHAQPEMTVMQSDVFAPLLSVMEFSDVEDALTAHRRCAYALTASVFGPEKVAAALARRIHAGTVLINDLIVSTADPRVSFGGRGKSGFGLTRGREGLLEMTAQKTVLIQRERNYRAYVSTREAHVSFFAAYIRMVHGGLWRKRVKGIRALSAAARKLR